MREIKEIKDAQDIVVKKIREMIGRNSKFPFSGEEDNMVRFAVKVTLDSIKSGEITLETGLEKI